MDEGKWTLQSWRLGEYITNTDTESREEALELAWGFAEEAYAVPYRLTAPGGSIVLDGIELVQAAWEHDQSCRAVTRRMT